MPQDASPCLGKNMEMVIMSSPKDWNPWCWGEITQGCCRQLHNISQNFECTYPFIQHYHTLGIYPTDVHRCEWKDVRTRLQTLLACKSNSLEIIQPPVKRRLPEYVVYACDDVPWSRENEEAHWLLFRRCLQDKLLNEKKQSIEYEYELPLC